MMIVRDVLERIAQGEGAKTEFKRDDVRAESLAKEIVAFANMNGGIILLGVDDDGSISGLSRKTPQAWLMDTVIGRHIHPLVIPEYEEFTIDGKTVGVVTVHEGMAKPYVLRRNDREDIYLRMGDTCRLAAREQAARLFDRGGLLDADKLPVHGSSFADLDERRCAGYFAGINKLHDTPLDDGGPDEGGLIDWLLNRDLLRQSSNGVVCAIAGLVLFGLNPSRKLPQASIRLAVFPGAGKTIDSLMDKSLSAPFVGLRRHGEADYIEPSFPGRVIDLLQPFISREVLNGVHRESQWDFPLDVIRELVVNAFAHRDWTRRTDTEISVYSDRMEVISPGALPNGMTVEKVKAGQRVPRNHNIINVLRDYGLMEHQGMGIRRTVIPSMLKHNGTEPDFEATEDLFKVTLWKKTGD